MRCLLAGVCYLWYAAQLSIILKMASATGPSLPAPAVAMLFAISCSVVTAGKRGMVNKSKRRVTFAMSKVQDCPADQENVPS